MRASKALAATALLFITLADVPSAQNAPTVIEAALRALGADSLSSITYSGTAALGNFGQSRTISFGLASSTIRNYTRTIDFAQSASRVTGFIALLPFTGCLNRASSSRWWGQTTAGTISSRSG
jgi:hypothetical protein